jgi:membrane protease YdiL (CAAX protease family)
VDPKTVQSLNDFFIAAAIIGGVAILIAIPSFILMRRSEESFCPRWRPPGVSWQIGALLMSLFPIGLVTFHATVGIVATEMGKIGIAPDDSEAAKQLRQIKATLLVAPAFFAMYYAVRKILRVPSDKNVTRNVLLGVVGWAVLIPLTFGVHFIVLQIYHALGFAEDSHPLTALHPQDDGTGGVLFAFAVCLCTPVVEECLFRGLLVPWAAQRRFGPWVLIGTAFTLAGLTSSHTLVPYLFVAILCVPLLLLQFAPSQKRVPRRTLACILSSSIVFAAAHSSVWPTPIPLFVLACGLGYLTARSRSIVPAVVVHGLFNAVSFVMLCRGTAF